MCDKTLDSSKSNIGVVYGLLQADACTIIVVYYFKVYLPTSARTITVFLFVAVDSLSN